MKCKLCESTDIRKFSEDKKKEYFQCEKCELVFVPEKYFLNTEQEKARYDLHENSISNEGYVRYLNDMVTIVKSLELLGIDILDFGSGKEAVLTRLLIENGYNCIAYDPLYENLSEINKSSVDCIILCEVIEHLRLLGRELQTIKRLMKTDSVLIIRTQMYPEQSEFLKWWYIQDPTHINLFSFRSIECIAKLLMCNLQKTKLNDVFVLRKY